MLIYKLLIKLFAWARSHFVRPSGARANKCFSDTGFTLIELLMTIAIFILISGAIFNIYILSQKFYIGGENQAELLQNGRIILERITREVRQAEEIVTALPQTPDNPDNPSPSEIEFQDGHTTSTDYYYIRYYLSTSSSEIYRQYRVYCFDSCSVCDTYFLWNDIKFEGAEKIETHPCNLEEKIIGEYVNDLKFWGTSLINASIKLEKNNKEVEVETKVFGRNL